MATLDISYYGGTGRLSDDIYGNWISTEQVTIGGAAAYSAGAPAGTAFAAINTNTACRVSRFTESAAGVGIAPTTTSGRYLPADGAAYDVTCRPGHVIGVIAATLA